MRYPLEFASFNLVSEKAVYTGIVTRVIGKLLSEGQTYEGSVRKILILFKKGEKEEDVVQDILLYLKENHSKIPLDAQWKVKKTLASGKEFYHLECNQEVVTGKFQGRAYKSLLEVAAMKLAKNLD